MTGEERFGPAFRVGLLAGVAIMAFGVHEMLGSGAATPVPSLAVWVVGFAVVHDLVLVPGVLLVGALVARFVPQFARLPVRAGLATSLVVLLVAWPGLRGYGRDTRPDNPTIQTNDYGRATLTVLAAVWAVALLWAAGRSRRGPTEDQSSRWTGPVRVQQPVHDTPGASTPDPADHGVGHGLDTP